MLLWCLCCGSIVSAELAGMMFFEALGFRVLLCNKPQEHVLFLLPLKMVWYDMAFRKAEGCVIQWGMSHCNRPPISNALTYSHLLWFN